MSKSIAEITVAITGGGTPARQIAEFWKGNIPWATVKDVKEGMKYLQDTEEHITETGLRSSASNLVTANSLIVCTRMAVGRSALTTRPTAINQDLKCLKIKPEYDVNFVYYQITNEQNTIEGQAIGSTVKGISVGELRKLSFYCPDSLPVQRKIARILSTIDGQIEKTEAIIAKYQAIKQGMLQDLFTRGIDVRTSQLRPRYEDAPDLYTESPLGMIPTEWEVVELQTVVAAPIVYGILMPGYGFRGGIPVIKVKNIYNDVIDTEELLLTSPAIAKQYSRSSLIEGDLLFTIRGTVGRCAFVPAMLTGSNITQDTARIRIQGINSLYVRYCFYMPEIRKYIELNTLGLAVKGINLKELRMLSIPYPSFEESNLIAQRLKALDDLVHNETRSLSKLQLLKQGLMQDLLSGKVEVKA